MSCVWLGVCCRSFHAVGLGQVAAFRRGQSPFAIGQGDRGGQLLAGRKHIRTLPGQRAAASAGLSAASAPAHLQDRLPEQRQLRQRVQRLHQYSLRPRLFFRTFFHITRAVFIAESFSVGKWRYSLFANRYSALSDGMRGPYSDG